MEEPQIALTAVFMKAHHGYVGFVAELPNVSCHASTLEEARASLQKLIALVFEEERRKSSELTAGKEVLRETIMIPIREPAWNGEERRQSAAARYSGLERRRRRRAAQQPD
jgi:predicted RNase H-like HicB family nuclease